ncbi:MAG: hypothetical protein WAR77_05415 [Saprospiraceae bacterium]
MSRLIQNKKITSALFSRFRKIPENAYYDYYYFYEYYFDQISQLDYEEYIEIKLNFIEALFNLDKYNILYKQIDLFVAELLNGQNFNDRQRFIYNQILIFKAEALKNENKYKASLKIYIELYKINPEVKTYRKKVFLMVLQEEQLFHKNNYRYIIGLLLLTLFLTAVSMVVLVPVNSKFEDLILYIRNGLFIISILGFMGLQLNHYQKTINRIKSMVIN